MTHRRLRPGERGLATATEAAVLIPALVMFVVLVAMLARDALHQQAVGAAAGQAARAASLERTGRNAAREARLVMVDVLRESGVRCQELSVDVDATGLRAPLGRPATVSVSVVCSVRHELSLPGMPAVRTYRESRSSPVDSYRGR